MVVGDQRHAQAALLRERDSVAMYRRLGRPQAQNRRVRKIKSPTGIRSPNRPARSELLYRPRYPDQRR
jgi:hypothetical protein